MGLRWSQAFAVGRGADFPEGHAHLPRSLVHRYWPPAWTATPTTASPVVRSASLCLPI